MRWHKTRRRGCAPGWTRSMLPAEEQQARAGDPLHQDYDRNDFEWDVTLHGPVLGSSVRF